MLKSPNSYPITLWKEDVYTNLFWRCYGKVISPVESIREEGKLPTAEILARLLHPYTCYGASVGKPSLFSPRRSSNQIAVKRFKLERSKKIRVDFCAMLSSGKMILLASEKNKQKKKTYVPSHIVLDTGSNYYITTIMWHPNEGQIRDKQHSKNQKSKLPGHKRVNRHRPKAQKWHQRWAEHFTWYKFVWMEALQILGLNTTLILCNTKNGSLQNTTNS